MDDTEYRIFCEECDRESIIIPTDEDSQVQFCPLCGRRAEPEEISGS